MTIIILALQKERTASDRTTDLGSVVFEKVDSQRSLRTKNSACSQAQGLAQPQPLAPAERERASGISDVKTDAFLQQLLAYAENDAGEEVLSKIPNWQFLPSERNETGRSASIPRAISPTLQSRSAADTGAGARKVGLGRSAETLAYVQIPVDSSRAGGAAGAEGGRKGKGKGPMGKSPSFISQQRETSRLEPVVEDLSPDELERTGTEPGRRVGGWKNNSRRDRADDNARRSKAR